MVNFLKELCKRWYLMLATIATLFLGVIVGMIALLIINLMGVPLMLSYTIASFLCGLIAAIPLFVLSAMLTKNIQIPRIQIIIFIVVAIVILSIIGFFMLILRI